MARRPASGPRPKATTKISAKTISGTVRQNSSQRLARKPIVLFGVRLRAERKEKMKPPMAPESVPT